MKQSKESIQKSIANLRAIIDNDEMGLIIQRIAYFAEQTLRWSIEDTVAWKRPEDDLPDTVYLIKKDIERHRKIIEEDLCSLL